MIKNLIFDFGAVIIDLNPQRCIEEFRKIGVPRIEEILSTAHQKGVLDQMERGQLTLDAFCDGVRALASDAQPMPTNRQIALAFSSMADGLPPYRLDCISQLRCEGYHVSVLSNTNQVHWGYCRRYFIEAGYVPEELFEYLWLSCEMKMVKPDPELFKACLDQSGYLPEETLFIDDNQKNCDVAATLGIHTFCPPVRSDWTAELRQLLTKMNA